MKLKIVGYKNNTGIVLPNNRIVYAIYGRQIVFSGIFRIEQGSRGSTINFAEEILGTIISAERIANPRRCEFFDLQTHRGYSDHEAGDYTFNKLHPNWRGDKPVLGMSWSEEHPEEKILEDFSEYIWGNYPRGIPRNLPVLRGSLRPAPKKVQPL